MLFFGAYQRRCISLSKLLLTNYCIYDCAYCQNRASNDIKRAYMSPQEMVRVVVEFYNRNYIEGVFLSSGIVKSPNYILVLREVHKFKGFLRFEMTELGFFARFAPRHDILEIVAVHFCKRFSDRRVIFDENRGVAALISSGKYKIVSATVDLHTRSDTEEEFVKLWRCFFNSVSIAHRKNEKAQKTLFLSDTENL